jgi:hypothetical protein
LGLGRSFDVGRDAWEELGCDRDRCNSRSRSLPAGLRAIAPVWELTLVPSGISGRCSGARGRGLGSLITSPPIVTGASSAETFPSWSSGGSGSGGGASHRPSGPLFGRSGCLPFFFRGYLGMLVVVSPDVEEGKICKSMVVLVASLFSVRWHPNYYRNTVYKKRDRRSVQVDAMD